MRPAARKKSAISSCRLRQTTDDGCDGSCALNVNAVRAATFSGWEMLDEAE
jgi:hypothetical protein